jgi:predicted permease
MMAYTNFFANLSLGTRAELVVGELVSEDYFGVLGVQPALGRAFSPDEFAAAGAGPVAILSHLFWQTRFGADPALLGRTMRMNGIVYTVVGVAPKSFRGMFPAVTAQMWIPLSMVEEVEPLGSNRSTGRSPGTTRLDRRGVHFLWVKGRMTPGVEVAQVRAELELVAGRLATQYPEVNELERVRVIPTNDVALNPDFDATVAPAGLVLLGAVGLVLLVACANLANMMLARSTSRRREMGLRLALGATPGRLTRQLLTESMLLAFGGGAVAMLLAYWLASLIARFQPPLPIQIGLNIAPDWRVLVFTFVASGVTGLAVGLIPALRASRPDLVSALKGTSPRSAGRNRRFELRHGLVVGQVAVSLVLLFGGTLLVRSLGAAGQVDFGYDPARVAYLGLALEMNGYDAETAGTFVEIGKLRLQQLPEVEEVGLASRVPLSLNNNGFGIFIDGRQTSGADRPFVMDGASVDEHYFDALGLRITSGRGIQPADRDERRRVAVVTRTMATRYWPGEEAVGRQFRTTWGGEPYQIVGIVEDYKVDTPGEQPKPCLHLPLPRNGTFANFVVRTNRAAEEVVPALERELRILDADLVFLETGSLQHLADVRLFPIRAGAVLIGVFGALALLLAAIGLYGVISYSVSQRVREIGVRQALGAKSGQVVRMVLREGLLLAGAGVVVGAGLATLGAQALSGVLFVSPFDPVSFAVAGGVLVGVAALANWVPARRAARVSPMVAVRAE